MADFVEDELKKLRAELAGMKEVQVITCHTSIVKVSIRHTDFKHLKVSLQFPEGYPGAPLLVEVASKSVQERLLEGLVRVCDDELRKLTGKRQVVPIIKFINEFVVENPFIVCSEELSYVRKELCRAGDEVKVRQKAGTIRYKAIQGRYLMDFRLSVPREYPAKSVVLDVKECNFPDELSQVFRGQAIEICRKCVEPPMLLRPSDPPFSPKPSLQLVAQHLVLQCVRRYSQEQCGVCGEQALPNDPKDVVEEESSTLYVYRVYCGHLFHHGCLETYMKTPPFEGGKQCPLCGERIAHERWKVCPRVAEERWAHRQAKQRELEEVADFLRV